MLMKTFRECLTKEDNVRLDQTIALWREAVRNLSFTDGLPHQIVRIGRSAFYAAVGGKTPVGFYDFVLRYTGFPIEAIDVLSEEF